MVLGLNSLANKRNMSKRTHVAIPLLLMPRSIINDDRTKV